MKRTLIIVSALVLLSSGSAGSVPGQEWDFPRLDEIVFKVKYPYTVSLEAAKACEIDTYAGAIRTVEVETLISPPYNWINTASPGFHMCYIGINCRDIAPETSGGQVDYHGRTPGFELYPLNLTAFRYALELIVGCNKTIWLTEIYGYMQSRLDTVVPPANVKWYNPNITPYPLDWTRAYNELVAAGFNGTIGGDDWTAPSGQPLREPIYVLTPLSPTGNDIVARHVKAWNAFFCGQEVAYPPHDCTFVVESVDFYSLLGIVFFNRDHDMYFLCWMLDRNPDYLWNHFHPDADFPDGSNSPGLDYRPLNAMIDTLKWCRCSEKVELRIFGPGPTNVPESHKHFTDYAFDVGAEEVWIGAQCGAGTYPYYLTRLEYGADYTCIVSEGRAVGMQFLHDIPLGADSYVHVVYALDTPVAINSESEMIDICWEIQEMMHYMCPYLPIYSRVYFDLYKPGTECWCPSLGYGSAPYQLKWTYGSIHWTGIPIGGTINWHLPGPISTLHPWLKTTSYEETILNRIYDGMLTISAYTHEDMPWCGLGYKIEDWTGPSGETGMKITWWTRSDLKWQDGDPITADDFIWDYEFINSIQPIQLQNIWGYYHGYEKHNDYCFSIYVNTTGVWAFYSFAEGPKYPRKVWLPFYGSKTAAEAFRPWETPHPNGTLPTSLYGSGEWIFDYYNSTLGTARLFKNTDWWGRAASGETRQVPGVRALTVSSKNSVPKVTKTSVGLCVFSLDTKTEVGHTWTFLMDNIVINSGALSLFPMNFSTWSESVPWQTPAGLHTFKLNVTNVYGSTIYAIPMYVLIGDGDDNNIINMLDLYNCAIHFGETGPLCWMPYDIDNSGLISMSDLYICAVNFGDLC